MSENRTSEGQAKGANTGTKGKEAPPEGTAQEQRSATEPSGYTGENPATAGPGNTRVDSGTPENEEGHLNPSAPGDSNTTPGSTGTK